MAHDDNDRTHEEFVEILKTVRLLARVAAAVPASRMNFTTGCMLYVTLRFTGTKEEFVGWCAQSWELAHDPELLSLIKGLQ